MINNGQSAAKSLNINLIHEKSSTTIPRKGSTVLEKLEKADIQFYKLRDELPKNPCVYGIYCEKNDKIYVGSCVNLNARIIRHLYYLTHNKHHSLKLQRVFTKYGEDSLYIIILENVGILENLHEKEQNWINVFDSFNTGLNCTATARYFKSFKLSKEQIEKRASKSRKSVMCFDFSGKFVTTYNSVTEAAKAIKDQSTNISSCCKGTLNFVKDLIFIYSKDFDPNKDYSYKGRTYVFSEEHKNKISKSLKGKKKTSVKVIEVLLKRCSKPVYKLDNNLNTLTRYSSMKECCMYNSIGIKTLRTHINKQTPLNGFIYKIDENIV